MEQFSVSHDDLIEATEVYCRSRQTEEYFNLISILEKNMIFFCLDDTGFHYRILVSRQDFNKVNDLIK